MLSPVGPVGGPRVRSRLPPANDLNSGARSGAFILPANPALSAATKLTVAGTESSNPSPSSGESTANPVGLAQVELASAAATLAVAGAALRSANPCALNGQREPKPQCCRVITAVIGCACVLGRPRGYRGRKAER